MSNASSPVKPRIPPTVGLKEFFDSPIGADAESIGRQVINRALASADRIDAHPELAGLDPDQLITVWTTVVFWFGIKSNALNHWDRD